MTPARRQPASLDRTLGLSVLAVGLALLAASAGAGWGLPLRLVLVGLSAASLVVLRHVLLRRNSEVRRLPDRITRPGPPLRLQDCSDAAELGAVINDLRWVLEDILARERKSRVALEGVDRDKTEFLKAVSHELRTPLNAILGFTDVLLAEIDGPLSASQREDLAHIRQSGTYLSNLFRDVIDLAAATSTELVIDPEWVPLRPLVEQVVSEVEAARGTRPVEIRWHVAESLTEVWGDPTRLHQVLGNLTHNALKFTDEGTVDLTVRPADNDEVEFSVRDSGQGISAEGLGRIFSEFERVGEKGRRVEGSGLGLAITKRLVDLHHGRVEVESELGQGSLFRVYLPRSPRPRRS